MKKRIYLFSYWNLAFFELSSLLVAFSFCLVMPCTNLQFFLLMKVTYHYLKSRISFWFVMHCSATMSLKEALHTVEVDSKWKARIVLPSSHFFERNGEILLRNIDKLLEKQTVDIIHLLSTFSPFEQNQSTLRNLCYPSECIFQLESFEGLESQGKIIEYIRSATRKHGSELVVSSSLKHYS